MKKHANGLQVGAYVAGGLVGLYLLGGAAFFRFLNEVYDSVPDVVFNILVSAFRPAAAFFRLIGVFERISGI